jgi:di/tricarboxylate transporter
MRGWTRLVAIVVGTTFVVQGTWAFVDPRSFYDTLATFEPYHPHFLRDIGTALVGVGAAAVVAALHPRPLVAGLAGLTAFQVLHLVSHVIDIDRGGNPGTDIPLFSLLASLTAAALVFELRQDRREA